MSGLSTWLQEALYLDYRIAGNFRGIQFSRMTVKPRKLNPRNKSLTLTCSCALSMGVATLACSRSISDRHTVIECLIRVLRTSLLLLSGFNGNTLLHGVANTSRRLAIQRSFPASIAMMDCVRVVTATLALWAEPEQVSIHAN